MIFFREVDKLKKRWRKAEKGRIDKDTDRQIYITEAREEQRKRELHVMIF